RRVVKEGLRGITSNPSIFNKAISSSSDYDSQIAKLVSLKKAVPEMYEELTVKDVQDACDILRPVFDSSNGVDGFVSIEVSPYLANDTEGTMIEARRLNEKVNRPNCLIKIPGTEAGVPAIEQMLYEGININVTLLFSIPSYEAVAIAYIKALERRVAEGKPIDKTASVASFFLSRIDVLADQLLAQLMIPERDQNNLPRPEDLLGKSAIASAKLAYQSFKNIYNGERWNTLVAKGAHVQRPLWASTSTKDPIYRDVKYVEPLIGRDTVNTLPDETITAFADHGVIVEDSIDKNVDEAKTVFSDLKKLGVDIDFVTKQLTNEGIQKFNEAYDKLMKDLNEKRKRILGETIGVQKINFADLKTETNLILKSLDEKQYARRVYARDAHLWKFEPEQVEEIKIRMGWLDSMEYFLSKADEIIELAKEIKKEKYKFVVLLGMGGSSLCPDVARETFGSKPGYPALFVLDNTDPAAVKDIEDKIDLAKTLFVVSSKSGTTMETDSFYKYFYEKIKLSTQGNPGDHFITITDRGTILVKEAEEKKFRRVFENPEEFGGRYSALSFFGIVPMALIGIDIKTILNSAHQLQLSCGSYIPSDSNPAVALGAFMGVCQKHGKDKITFILAKSIYSFGYWVEQLIAESTGKEGVGIIPVESEELGSPAVYGDDRLFVYIYTSKDHESSVEKKLAALEKANHYVVRIDISNISSLGAEFFRWELATATAGKIININPFDQPNVAESKKNTGNLLSEWKKNGAFENESPIVQEGELKIYCDENSKWLFQGHRKSAGDFLNYYFRLAQPHDYIAMLAYFLKTPLRDKFLQALRMKLRNAKSIATTLGYGPRYLHSTGQLHKGGPNKGLFLIFTADSRIDLPIPDEQFGFATLQRAQALGDYRSLNNHNCRVIRIHLGNDIEKGLKLLAEKIKV
ncbi:MAG TPA: bifunctional transaldolase/phosoglucose isomerase, partial [Ignavibacteriaceae bacterium]|nr:bifunctional transaldolase/phosoglucose isomerase [Ignavibacteriaceae bacterium]